MAKITRNLPNDEYQAAVGANAPSPANVYATMADVGGGGSGVFTPTINNVTMKEVSVEADFGAPDGLGVITLDPNTTYFIRGEVSCTNRILIEDEGISLKGWDREADSLAYIGADGAGDFITIDNVNCEISGLKLSSTNSKVLDVVLRAFNFNYVDYNGGRNKVLTLINCQFRNCFDVHHIEGFDLVDMQNTLVWYVKATGMGCHFKNVSKLQISSCEYVRWFDETLIGTLAFNPSLAYIAGAKVIEAGIFYESISGSTAHAFDPLEWSAVGYATTPMVELLAKGVGEPGFGAVNISGSIFHPQQTQDGINISDLATIGFGTISGNTGISLGLTTGAVTNIDYNIQNSTIIQANQGITNGNAFATMNLSANLIRLRTSAGVQVLKAANVVAPDPDFTTPISFPISQRTINTIADGSINYNSKIDANFVVIVTATVQQPGTGTITMRLRNGGVPITFSVGSTGVKQAIADQLSFSIIGQASRGDIFDVDVQSSNGDDVLVSEFTLNGYQF